MFVIATHLLRANATCIFVAKVKTTTVKGLSVELILFPCLDTSPNNGVFFGHKLQLVNSRCSVRHTSAVERQLIPIHCCYIYQFSGISGAKSTYATFHAQTFFIGYLWAEQIGCAFPSAACIIVADGCTAHADDDELSNKSRGNIRRRRQQMLLPS